MNATAARQIVLDMTYVTYCKGKNHNIGTHGHPNRNHLKEA